MSGVKRGQGLKATYCDVCVCGTYVHVVPVVRVRAHARDFYVIDDLVPTSAIISISLQKLVNCRAFSYLQRRQRRGHGENLLPPLRFYVQERHPGRATSPASNVTGRPS